MKPQSFRMMTNIILYKHRPVEEWALRLTGVPSIEQIHLYKAHSTHSGEPVSLPILLGFLGLVASVSEVLEGVGMKLTKLRL